MSSFTLTGHAIALTNEPARALLHVRPEGGGELMPLEVPEALQASAHALVTRRQRVRLSGHLEVGVFLEQGRQRNQAVLILDAVATLDA